MVGNRGVDSDTGDCSGDQVGVDVLVGPGDLVLFVGVVADGTAFFPETTMIFVRAYDCAAMARYGGRRSAAVMAGHADGINDSVIAGVG